MEKGTREMIINLDIPSWLLIFACVLFGIKTILELTNAWLDWKLRKAQEK